MSFLKKLSFGKKKATNIETTAGRDTLDVDGAAHGHDGHDDGFIDGIDESVVESLSIGHESVNGAENHGHGHDHDNHGEGVGESVAASSTDMSPESIVSTKNDAMMFDEAQPEKTGIGSKFKSMFAGKKNKTHQGDVHESNDLDEIHVAQPGNNLVADQVEERMQNIVADIGAKPRPLPFIGGLSSRTQYGFALTLMALSLTAAGYLSINSLLSQSGLKDRANLVTRTQLATQSLTLTAQNLVVRSDPAAASTLAAERTALKDASAQIAKDAKSEYSVSMVKAIDTEIIPTVERALGIAAEIATIGRQAGVLERNTAALYQFADQFTAYLQSTSNSPLVLAATADMRVRAERMKGNGIKMLTANSLNLAPLSELGADVNEMKKLLALLQEENSGLDENSHTFLGELTDSNSAVGAVNIFLQKYAKDIVQSRVEVVRMRDAVNSVSFAGTSYIDALNKDSDAYSSQIYIALGLVAFGVLALGLLSLINSRLTRIEAWSTAYKNKSNERDIIEFMGEIMPLEMGDLTSSFTNNTGAMEGITGGIRSSVNEAVASLRDAMNTVKNTTGSVMTNVSDSVESSRDLQNSNNRQAKEIEGVVDRVANLAAAIQEVTNNTTRAAEITSSAKSASDAGAHVVGQTNEKMAEIRTNMQDVLKSVKHLGETSHEIGTIVEAIETITDRTQVIAVNASLEAAKAGAAGQGFQVLAGEVNRLAEQSNEALRTITALVQRIQGETAATIRVVEDSTNNVVEGAKLSESANVELTRISELSVQLQAVMNTIREQSESQTSNAGQVRESMDRLNNLSTEFQSTVSHMVAGVQQIDASMGTLKSTVSIFTTEKVALQD